MARKKQVTYRDKLLGPVQEVQVGGPDVDVVVLGLLDLQVLAPGSSVFRQLSVNRQRQPKGHIQRLANRLCVVNNNLFLPPQYYEQFGGLVAYTQAVLTLTAMVFPYGE